MSTGSHLAALLSSQLAAVAPEGFSLEGDGGDVTITYGAQPLRVHVSAIVGDAEASPEAVTNASLAAISEVQDYIARVLGTPWPSAVPSTRLALPVAEWQGDRLRLLYGDPKDPTLELEGIAASELWG